MVKRGVLLTVSLAIAALAVVVTSLPAEAAGYYRKGTFAAGGGFNFPVGEAADYLSSSGTMFFGGGRHLNKSTSVQVEWTHNWLGINQDVLDRAASDSLTFDDAYASMWSVTLNMYRRFNPDSDIVPWLTGGIGYYKRNVQITQNAYVYYPPIWDPWWGWVGGGWAPGEVVTGSREDAGFGFNVGVGVDLEIENGASLFIDARYHQAILDGVDMTIIPIMAGIRW